MYSNKCYRYLLAVMFSFLTATAKAQEPVLPFSTVQMPASWYKKQMTAWQKIVDKEPGNAMAWYNLYYAKRILMFHDRDDKRPWEKKQKEIEGVVQSMQDRIPGTYEYNLVKWLAGGLDFNSLPYLIKANELANGRTEHLTHMMNVAEIKGNVSERNAYALQLYNAGKISPGMLYYNYNVLAGLDSGAILLVIGDNDTYPAMILQAMDIRPDVFILNTSLLLADDYREKLFGKLGIKNIKVDWQKDGDTAELHFQRRLTRLLINNKAKLPVYISLTASGILSLSERSLQDNLYLVGMAYKYSAKPLDNMAILRKNFEQVYKLDYLQLPLYPDISSAIVKRINTNYTIPVTRLREHYKISGDTRSEMRMKSLLEYISSAETGNTIHE